MGSPFHHAGDGHELVIDRYLHNDQLGSPSSGSGASLRFVPFRNGLSDASGNLLAEIDYLDYGEPVYMPVLASPPHDDITNSVYDSGNDKLRLRDEQVLNLPRNWCEGQRRLRTTDEGRSVQLRVSSYNS